MGVQRTRRGVVRKSERGYREPDWDLSRWCCSLLALRDKPIPSLYAQLAAFQQAGDQANAAEFAVIASNFDMRTELELGFFGQSDSPSAWPYHTVLGRVPAIRQPVTVPQRAERCRYGDGNRITDTVYTAFTGYGGQP
ncbi:hypothetical protein PILCRDRAFT_736564 [Piloderma croceum F 1598]|uniref:Uncharacterized protein n=1 Tax=Piloderma croceum (strain F 1598) TaxID=765440 RepID=A0A0C3EY16_PILCF|nr:hypothetical protein PILCRDRAFT_736564 [Piloderma croceum F 1598]